MFSMKTCSRCHETKPYDQYSRDARYADGYFSYCRSCNTAYKAAYRAANKEQDRQQRRKDNKKWRESPQGKEYVANNAEKRRAYLQTYYTKNADRRAAHAAAYYQRTKEAHDARTVAWHKAHPEELAAIQRRRRARKKAAPINDLTAEQWQEILVAYNYRCVYCPPSCTYCRNKTHALTQDHIVPYAKGGSNTLSNIVPCCKSCNSKKATKEVPVPVQPLLLTVAPSKKKRNNNP